MVNLKEPNLGFDFLLQSFSFGGKCKTICHCVLLAVHGKDSVTLLKLNGKFK